MSPVHANQIIAKGLFSKWTIILARPSRISPPLRHLVSLQFWNFPSYLLFAAAWQSNLIRLIFLITGPILLFGYVLVNRVFWQFWKAAHGSFLSFVLVQLLLLLAAFGIFFLGKALIPWPPAF